MVEVAPAYDHAEITTVAAAQPPPANVFWAWILGIVAHELLALMLLGR